MSSLKCSVCSRPTTLFNYGVLTCNACKMFFRRAVLSRRPKVCWSPEKCSTTFPLQCRHCRFQRCLQVGMRSELVGEHQLATNSTDSTALVKLLSALDISREKNVVKWDFPEDLTLVQLLHGSVWFPSKPPNSNYNAIDWRCMEQVTTIDFIRNLQFMKNLMSEDSEVFIRNTFFEWSCFSLTWRNFCEKRDAVMYHGGVDVFPAGTSDLGVFSPELLRRIRSRLIGKFCELKLSREEYLLVGAMLFCNPAICGLSISAQGFVASEQRKYASALLQLCLITYQHSGPSRFSDLLSLSTVINESFQDVVHYIMIRNMSFPRTMELRQFYVDLYKFRF